MKNPLHPAGRVATAVADFEREHDTSVYVTLAKAVLWIVSVALVGVVLGCTALVVFAKDAGQISNVVGASQALVVISLSVLGFHNYKGSHLFHVLRSFQTAENIKEEKE